MSLTLPGVCCPPVSANGSHDLAVQCTCHALHLTFGFTIRFTAWLRSRSPSTRPAQSVLSNTRHTGLIRRTGFTGRYLLDDLSPLDPSRWVSTSPGTTRTRPLDMGPPGFVTPRRGSLHRAFVHYRLSACGIGDFEG